MSGPVSLRICCIAAMAPALTEAATQSARVKLPLCSPTGGSAEPADRLLDAKHLVIERSSGLKNNHIGPISTKDLHQFVNGDHLQGEVSLVSSEKDKSKYLAIGGKLLDLSSLVSLPQVLRDQLSECLSDPGELVKMNQPIRLFVNGTSKMTVNDSQSHVEGEVYMCDKGPSLLKSVNVSEDSATDRGAGDDGALEPIPEFGNSGGGDAPEMDVPPRAKATPQDLLQDMDRRQHLQERRAQRLLRRLRRLQSRQSHGHISNQLSEYVSYHHHNLETMAQNIKSSAQQSPTCPIPGTSTDFTPEMLSNDRIRSLSTAALVNLVRKLQSTQSPMSLRQRTTQAEAPTTLLRMNKSVRAESDRAADQLMYNLRHIERGLDSDATESSSGGESGDECSIEPMRRLEPSSYVSRSALWQWSRDRAQVAARWTWLQAQVSDLEYRIRTQSEIYRQLRVSKGAIQLTEREPSFKNNAVTASPANLNNILTNMDRQTCHVTQSLGPLTPMATPSGTPVQSPKRTPSSVNGLVDDSECPAARCLSVSGYRRRRLFRTQGLYTTSRKAARLSTVSCRCYPPATTCAMCMGRYNHVMPLDSDMPRNEKLALLDAGYHPVLSFPEDVPLPLVMEPLVRTAVGLQKAAPRYLGRSPTEKTNKYRKKYQRNGQSKSKKLKKTAANLLSMKYKTRLSDRSASPKQSKGRESTRGLSRAEMRKRKKLKLALKRERCSTSVSRQNSAQASPRDSPLPSGSHSMREMKNWLKKKAENNYDIDNIVIPHSIAATTRVEKLEYKEIITPKWRLNPIEPCASEPQVGEEIEDLTDDMFASRHVICEVREKQRYLHFVTSGRKKSGSMRTESGANTPDPFQDGESQTPPVTPSPMDSRRRSSSVTRSRAQSVCETRACSPDPEDFRPPVSAWEPRRFPLTDVQYQQLLKDTDRTPEKRPRKTVRYQDFLESGQTSVATTPGSSRPVSPLTSDDVDEASDPEWSVKQPA